METWRWSECCLCPEQNESRPSWTKVYDLWEQSKWNVNLHTRDNRLCYALYRQKQLWHWTKKHSRENLSFQLFLYLAHLCQKHLCFGGYRGSIGQIGFAQCYFLSSYFSKKYLEKIGGRQQCREDPDNNSLIWQEINKHERNPDEHSQTQPSSRRKELR